MAKLNWSRPRRDISHLGTPSTDSMAAFKPQPKIEKRWGKAKLEPETPREDVVISAIDKTFIMQCVSAVKKGTFEPKVLPKNAPKLVRGRVLAAGGPLPWIRASDKRLALFEHFVTKHKPSPQQQNKAILKDEASMRARHERLLASRKAKAGNAPDEFLADFIVTES